MSATLNDFVAQHAAVVVPSNTADNTGQALFVSGAGNVVLDTEAGETSITFTAVPANTFIRLRFVRIRTASTATGMKRFWG